MIISNDKKVIAYNGDYKPVNVYSGRTKVAGYTTEEFNGKHIEVEDTYNDVLDVAVQGHHEQDSRNAVWWNQLVGGEHTIIGVHKYYIRYEDGTFGVYLGSNVNEDYAIILVDLTAMFGEGKEPTAEQFRKMYPCDYYPYCEGEWKYAPKGQWVKFNQLLPIRQNFSQSNKGSKVIGNNDGSYTVSGTPIAYCAFGSMHNIVGIINHKYLLTGCPDGSVTTGTNGGTYDLRCQVLAINKYYTDNGNGVVINYIEGSTSINIYLRTSIDYNGEPVIFKPNLIDLTEMFGEGNEPKSVEQFKALYPEEYYEYTKGRYEDTGGFVVDGEVVPNDVDSAFMTPMPELPEDVKAVEEPKVKVSSEKAPSRLEGQEVTLPFTLYGHDGVNDECEPCVLVDGEWKCRVTRRWKTRKLISSLKWSTQGTNLYSAYVSDIDKTLSYGAKAPLYCSHLQIGTVAYNEGDFNNDRLFQYIRTTGIMYRNVGRFEDINDFKNKLKDVDLLYRLETPIIELYDPIPVRTLPINTIIDCEAEMRAKIKRVDKHNGESRSIN